jgi:hypothetical protein
MEREAYEAMVELFYYFDANAFYHSVDKRLYIFTGRDSLSVHLEICPFFNVNQPSPLSHQDMF